MFAFDDNEADKIDKSRNFCEKLVEKYQIFPAIQKEDKVFQIHVDQLGKEISFFVRYCFIHSLGEGKR